MTRETIFSIHFNPSTYWYDGLTRHITEFFGSDLVKTISVKFYNRKTDKYPVIKKVTVTLTGEISPTLIVNRVHDNIATDVISNITFDGIFVFNF